MRTCIAIAAAALALAACSIGPAYKRPDVTPPGAYRGQSEQPSAKSFADVAWWELYRDPVLEKLILTALKQNYDVRIAISRVDEFRAVAGIASIGSIPQIAVGGTATKNAYSTIGPTPYPATAQTVNPSYSPSIVASYEIDLWRRIASLNQAARADLLASEFARDTTRITVISDVASTYFALRALDQQLAITERTVAARQKFLELTRAQFSRGVVSGLDVNRAEASLATARALIPDLKSQIAQTENQLHVLLGENPDPILRGAVAEGDFFPQPVEVPAGLPAALLERRPDLRQAENVLIGANARLRAVKASLFPTISITGSYGYTSAALSTLFTSPAKVWTYGLDFLQPIIDASRNPYQVDAYSAREKQAILQYQQAVAQAFREVSDALAARQGYAESLRAQDEQVIALREANRRVLKRYAIGYSSYFEVIDADSSLYQAELARAQVYRNALTSLVQLYKALGGGWQVAADELPKTGAASPPAGPAAGGVAQTRVAP